MKLSRIILFLVFSASIVYAAYASERQVKAAPAFTTETLRITTTHGDHVFQVEVARTAEEMQQGLMFREEIPPHTGMLFDLGEERRASMWMKNTLTPLDMLFIDKTGTIVDLARNATPLSLRPIISSRPVVAILEIKGGASNHYGIQLGDTVHHAMFGNTK